VTVGVFDGVHIAHRQLIRAAVALAHCLRGTSVVVTFDPDPEAVLTPRTAAPPLMPLDVRAREIAALGADVLWVIRFTKRFARWPAAAFCRRLLLGRLRARALIVGEAFAFGRGRRGNMALLRAVGAAHGLRVIALRPVTRGGKPVSSSRVRALIARGDVARARALLGRPPALYGRPARGAGRGKRLGYPTLNVRLRSRVLPPHGVYAVTVSDGARRWPGVMNLGVRPTFGPGPLTCEVHCFGFSGRVRRDLAISLLARLRGERRFPTVAALQRQLRRDVARARRIHARAARRR
jgi:riboflavin kinase/FMN adenylyltransferase